jgi:PrsW family intramembrane metalloprotease
LQKARSCAYTGIFGAGLGLGTWSRTRAGQIGWPLLGLAVAMLLHAFNNGFAELVVVLKYGYNEVASVLLEGQGPAELVRQLDDTFASAVTIIEVVDYAMVAMFLGAILLGARYQRRVLRYELAEEANAGLITREEWEIVPSYTRRVKWYAKLRFAGVRARPRAVASGQARASRPRRAGVSEVAAASGRGPRDGGRASPPADHRAEAAAGRRSVHRRSRAHLAQR